MVELVRNTRLRAGGAWGHLLLVAVLALGVFAMHTMGHPEHSTGRAADAVAHAAAGAHHGGMAGEAAGLSAAPASGPSVDAPVIGMDVLSVCVAVLSGWLLWVFLCAAALRKERLPALLARAMAVLRPGSPPPEPLLARLSVLRI